MVMVVVLDVVVVVTVVVVVGECQCRAPVGGVGGGPALPGPPPRRLHPLCAPGNPASPLQYFNYTRSLKSLSIFCQPVLYYFLRLLNVAKRCVDSSEATAQARPKAWRTVVARLPFFTGRYQVRGRRQEAGGKRQEAGSRRQEAGGRR